MERDGDLEGGVDRLGAGVGEEGMIEPARGDLYQLVRELERGRMCHLERRREIERLELSGNRLSDLAPSVAGVDAPEPRDAIEDLPAIDRPVVHAARPRQQPGLCLELPVGGEGQPQRFEIGARERGNGRSGVGHGRRSGRGGAGAE